MMQSTFRWNWFTSRWEVLDRSRVDSVPDLQAVAEASGIDAHEPIRVEITRLDDIVAALETYLPCLECHPDHAPVLTNHNAAYHPEAGNLPSLGDAVTVRQAAAMWGVGRSRAAQILATVEALPMRDQLTGAKLYPTEAADDARRNQPGQGRRTDLTGKL